MKLRLPIARHAPAGARYWLIQRVMCRRGERSARNILLASVVVEPILARLKARNDGVVSPPRVGRGVLARRVVTASDVAALGAPSQMEPPAS